MSTKWTIYYDGYGSYDCPKDFLPIKPLEEVKKKLNKKIVIQKIGQRRKWALDQVYTMAGTVVMVVQKFSFNKTP